MKVCVDIQAAITQRAGVGRYAKSLVEHLAPLAGGDELSLFYFDFKRRGLPFPVPGATQKAVHWCPGRIAQKAWKTFAWPPFDTFSGPADLFHFPNFIRPPIRRGKSVTTIHDLSFLRFSETTEARNLRYLKAWIQKTVAHSEAILTVSEFVAREICDLLKAPAHKVHPIHSGLDPHLRRPDDAAIAAFRRAQKLERPYLLMVGTVEPRKNIPFLVEVFEQLKGFDGDLVIAGMLGWKYEPILERIQRSPLCERIRHLPFVEDHDLPALYAGAELFVFPSLYEGFGFTPLEAMACGTPVISSSEGSLLEVLGQAALLLSTFSAGEWAQAIEHLLGDSGQRARQVQMGLEQALRYTWEECARKTWALYRSL